MNEHKPLVLIDGELSQLPDGDYISGEEKDVPQRKEVDFDDPNGYIYKGWAPLNSLTSDPVWKIQRIEFVGADQDVTYKWSDSANYSQIWDNRAVLTYT